MKHLFLLSMLFIGVSFVFGQAPTPRPTPMTAAQAQPRRDNNVQSPLNQTRLNANGAAIPQREIIRINNVRKDVEKQLYRKPTKSELQNILVDAGLFEKYKVFLESKNTGLIRLVPDLDCSLSDRVLVTSEYCSKYSMPGNGAAYSFRTGHYRIKRLADLFFKENYFYSGGSYIESVMANLGDKDISLLTLNSEGVKEITELTPVKEVEFLKDTLERLKKGLMVNSILYSNRVSAGKDSTYILRSIAFDTKNFISVNGYTYDEFHYDKRRDVVIAFRVVEKNNDGSVVILWKELRNEKSPKLALK
jgi:hypothetical protein